MSGYHIPNQRRHLGLVKGNKPVGIVVERKRDCDLCGSMEGVQQYRIAFVADGKQISVDLCSEHAAPLEEVRATYPEGKRGRPKTQKVVTEAEVKKARTRKTTKKATTPKRSSGAGAKPVPADRLRS